MEVWAAQLARLIEGGSLAQPRLADHEKGPTTAPSRTVEETDRGLRDGLPLQLHGMSVTRWPRRSETTKCQVDTFRPSC
jgi:hypothetical protein